MKSKSLFKTVLLTLILLLAIPTMAMAEYFVSPTGDNSDEGTSAESPWQTIQYAVDNVPDGNMILLMDGTFTENVNVTRTIIIRSVDWEDNTENDSTVVIAASSTDHVFEITASDVIVEGLTIYGATGVNKAGIYIDSGETNCTIANNICGLGSGNANYYGILLNQASDNNISNNTCNYNNYDGIRITDSSTNTIFQNTCTNNSYNGIRVLNTSGSSGDNIISDNYFADNGDSGIDIDTAGNNTFLYNTLYSNNVRGLTIGSGSSGNRFYLNNFDSNPASVSSASGNVNAWSSNTEVEYYYNGEWRTGYLGNYFNDHTLTDSNGDGITDSTYDLPNDEPDDAYPVAVTPDNYTFLERGLVAYYPFNGNANDESEFYSNNGVVTGADLTTDRFNNSDSAYLFGGSTEDDKIDCGNKNVFNTSKALTLSAWIKPASLTGRILRRRGYGGFDFDIYSNTLRIGYNGHIKCQSDIPGMEDQWLFVTTTWDGATSKIFVNGALKKSDDFTDSIYSHNNELIIGGYASTSGRFDGVIDEVRIYNRALSQEEITKLYNEGKAKINAGVMMLLLN